MRRREMRRSLTLEYLEARSCPAIATWIGGISNLWINPNNWSWNDNSLNANYPGDTANRTTDQVVISNKAVDDCSLSTDLKASLLALSFDDSNTTLTVGGNITLVGGSNLGMNSGTINISQNKVLLLGGDPLTDGNQWSGGNITGLGTLEVDGILFIEHAGSSLGCDLVIDGIVQLRDSMTGNLALSGESNNITVESGGELTLRAVLTSAQAYTRGGITGGNDHEIWVKSGGIMSRGYYDYTVGGAVLVSVPVAIDGTLNVYYAEQTYYQKNILKISGADSVYGHSLVVKGRVNMQANTEITVNNDIYINNSTAEFTVYTGAAYTTSINGNVLFGSNGGYFNILEDSTGDYGYVNIVGNITFTAAAHLSLGWGSTDNDVLSVTGTANLAGTLHILGAGPTPGGVWCTILTANTLTGDFGSIVWSFGTLTSRKQGGSFQIKSDDNGGMG